jgi:hypothetical protein
MQKKFPFGLFKPGFAQGINKASCPLGCPIFWIFLSASSWSYLKLASYKPVMVVHAYNPSTQEAEAGYLRV